MLLLGWEYSIIISHTIKRRHLVRYIIAARRRLDLSSEHQLATRLGVSSSAISRWRRSVAIPSVPNMMRLAMVAGASIERALLERNAWRAPGLPARIYRQIIATLNLK